MFVGLLIFKKKNLYVIHFCDYIYNDTIDPFLKPTHTTKLYPYPTEIAAKVFCNII